MYRILLLIYFDYYLLLAINNYYIIQLVSAKCSINCQLVKYEEGYVRTIHADDCERMTFQCEICPYRTVTTQSLKGKHVLLDTLSGIEMQSRSSNMFDLLHNNILY